MVLFNVLDLVTDAVGVLLRVVMPVMLAMLCVGVVIGLLQSVTQIQEMTLSFVPKVIVFFVLLLLLGSYIGESLNDFFYRCLALIAQVRPFS